MLSVVVLAFIALRCAVGFDNVFVAVNGRDCVCDFLFELFHSTDVLTQRTVPVKVFVSNIDVEQYHAILFLPVNSC